MALARAGLTIADGQATPGLAAKLHAMEARGFALLGDAREVRHAVLAAQRCYESAIPEDAAGVYTARCFGDDLGTGLRGIGDTEQAIKFSTMALDSCEPWVVRGRCVVQTGLALTHLHGRDLEQAASFGRDALRTATDLSSAITLERLRTLHRQVAPLRTSSPQMLDLDERLTGFLTRTASRNQHDTAL